MSSGAGFVYNPRHTPPQSQDAAGLDMGLYDHRSPLRKEDFGIITTTLDGIMNSVNVLADEIRNHTSILLSKLEERAKSSSSGACFICHQQGHWAPECPDRQSRPKPTSNQCFKCGQDGHWVRDCPENLPPAPMQQPLPLPPAPKKTQKRKAENKKKESAAKKPAKEWMCLIFLGLTKHWHFFYSIVKNTFLSSYWCFNMVCVFWLQFVFE